MRDVKQKTHNPGENHIRRFERVIILLLSLAILTGCSVNSGKTNPSEAPRSTEPTGNVVIVNTPELTNEPDPTPPLEQGTDSVPTDVLPTDIIPTDIIGTDALPTEAAPTDALPTEIVSTSQPTTALTEPPRVTATAAPTNKPTAAPTATPTVRPTATPTQRPTATPTVKPDTTTTQRPTATPTVRPTATPTQRPTVTPTVKPNATPTQRPTATPTVRPTATPTIPAEEGYYHNEYYDVVEIVYMTNQYDSKYLIHKVLAKKDATIEGAVTVYSSDGSNAIDYTDTIILTSGKYNYFEYSLRDDLPDDFDVDAQFSVEKEYQYMGDRNAVEMVKYNTHGYYSYVTFKQVSERLGSWAKYKILYYKNGQIIDTAYSYFTSSGVGLSGKGSTTVETLWTYGIDFDYLEFIFEPSTYYSSSSTPPPIIEFYHNEYYDVVEVVNNIRYESSSEIIYKVLAKKDVSIESAIIAYDRNGNVVGKQTDQIVLTAGKNNYFHYYFDVIVDDTITLEMRTIEESESFYIGERNAVVMTDYYREKYKLYISVEQVAEKISTFAKIKLLFYKNNKIINVDEYYISTYAQNLSGIGTTDTISFYVWDDFDNIEFIYEP